VARDMGLVAGSCERGDEPLGSVIGEVGNVLMNRADITILSRTDLYGVSIWFIRSKNSTSVCEPILLVSSVG
jgi:hypothetical protein